MQRAGKPTTTSLFILNYFVNLAKYFFFTGLTYSPILLIQLHIMQQGGERVANLKKMEELNKRYENSKKQCEEYQVEIERLKEENATQQV